MSNDEKGTGRNSASPGGAPKGAYQPDKKTAELLEYQKNNFANPENPLARLSLGKKLQEMTPEVKPEDKKE